MTEKATKAPRELPEHLVRLKKRLPSKYVKITHKKRADRGEEVSEDLIWKVANGYRENNSVMLDLLDVADEHEKEQSEIAKRLKQL